MDRAAFIRTLSVSGLAAAMPSALQGATILPYHFMSMEQKPAALSPDLVRDFVIAGHGNLHKVKTMLAADPGLLNASWDWGGGDFEMAIGGAGHMGRADIAYYLIAQGGRFDLFVAAMLGMLDAVRAMVALDPAVVRSKGPHGITLMAHALKGGDRAIPVLEFLRKKGIEE
jgi:hypothetical protein